MFEIIAMIDFLVPKNSYTIHNCMVGNCVKRAKYKTQLYNDRKNMCLYHAKQFCQKNNLSMPKK